MLKWCIRGRDIRGRESTGCDSSGRDIRAMACSKAAYTYPPTYLNLWKKPFSLRWLKSHKILSL